MDLYRYFHPHHNPRLRSVPLRSQELAELEQGAIELAKALKRAQIRSGNAPVAGFATERFALVLEAAQFIVDSLSAISRSYPEDDLGVMRQLLSERKDAPGWETWTRLLKQRLQLVHECDELQLPPARVDTIPNAMQRVEPENTGEE